MTHDNPKAAALRAKLDVGKPALAMAAHNPLAAKLAANAGFDAIWGSGFELSASYAVPDANILPMRFRPRRSSPISTQALETP
jgi:2-methylisocitrate lyase-like PEP mutase family enzyme